MRVPGLSLDFGDHWPTSSRFRNGHGADSKLGFQSHLDIGFLWIDDIHAYENDGLEVVE